jgi:hypothetical protein
MIVFLLILNMQRKKFTSQLVAYKKGNVFIAVALDFDLFVEGSSLGNALNMLDESIRGYLIMCIEDGESDDQIYRKAPQKYFDIRSLIIDEAKKVRKTATNKVKEPFFGTTTINKSALSNV